MFIFYFFPVNLKKCITLLCLYILLKSSFKHNTTTIMLLLFSNKKVLSQYIILISFFLIHITQIKALELYDITNDSIYSILDSGLANFNAKKISASVDLNSLNVLQEAIPVKDSLTYGNTLNYKFVPNLGNEWTHSYQIVVYLSGSLCQLPENWDTNTSTNGLTIYYTFNETIAQQQDIQLMNLVEFTNGFASGLAEIRVTPDVTDYSLYISIVPDYCSTCNEQSTWVFEFATSQKNILFLYDTEPRISVVDVDYDTAIFQAQEIIFGHNRSYGMYLFEDEYPIPIALNQSWCAISEVANYSKKIAINETITEANQNSFIISDLNVGKQYAGVLVITYSNLPYGGGVFEPFSFTMSKTKSCKLAYGLDFCDEVAYAVPISSNLLYGKESWEAFISAYDNYTESLYQPFNYAMQQIDCDTELDARYSPIRTCDDCKYSYKQWLCAVTIPRCVSSLDSGPYNKIYDAGDGRNDFIAHEINPPLPYAEVLPCLNVCQAIVRDCPAIFSFGCPETAELVALSYGDPYLMEADTKNDTNIMIEKEHPDDDKPTPVGISTTIGIDGDIQTYRICNYLGRSNLPTTS
jgi:calcium channel MID1